MYQQIEALIREKSIKQIVLFGGSEYTLLPSFGGEGEGKSVLYKASWFYNAFIYQLFSSDIEIEWRKKEKRIKFYFIQRTRDTLFQIKAVLFHIKSLSKGFYCTGLTSEPKNNIIYSNLPVQQSHLKHIQDRILQTDADVYALYRPNDDLWPQIKKCVYKKNKKIISTFLKANRLKFSNTQNSFLQYDKSAFLSLYRTYYLYFLYEYNSIKDVIPKALGPNTSIISDMTLGLDIFALNQVCRELGYKHINYQYVSMAPLSLPIYEMADEYYIYSKETFDLYSQKSSIFKRYMILKRDPELPLKITRITLFLQPDEYTQSYIDFLGELCDLYYTRNAEFQIFIKPHPRQDRVNEFDNYVKQYPFLKWTKKDLSADEAIKSTDIVISILSTTLYEAFTFGTIGVICNYKEMYTDVVTTEACCSEVNFMITNASDLYDLIDDYEKTREDYLNRYYKFLERINNQ